MEDMVICRFFKNLSACIRLVEELASVTHRGGSRLFSSYAAFLYSTALFCVVVFAGRYTYICF